jgi:hypothetical protein
LTPVQRKELEQLEHLFLGCCSALYEHCKPNAPNEFVNDYINTYEINVYRNWIVANDHDNDAVVTVKLTTPNFCVDMKFDHGNNTAEFWDRTLNSRMFAVSRVSST